MANCGVAVTSCGGRGKGSHYSYSFGYGSRGRRASPVSPVGKCWLWGFFGSLNPLPGLFLCGFGVFRVRATVGTWLSRSACPRCPPFPPMVPCTRRARCARLCFFGSRVVSGDGCSSGAFCVFCRVFF